MTGPSDKAIELVAKRIYDYSYSGEAPDPQLAREALEVAHDPKLGLDRSVCLRDVIAVIRGAKKPTGSDWDRADWADFIKEEFSE